jgi:hypothetical protein
MEAGDYVFVGPDNGLFSFVYAREKHLRVFHAAREEFFRARVSATFHGRDVFAPLAAWLAKGIAPENFGVEIDDYVRFDLPQPQRAGESITGVVIHVDHFGNCITNLTEKELQLQDITASTRLVSANHVVKTFGTHFAQTQSQAEPLAYLGSAGYWEIALWQDSAAQRLGLQRGSEVQLWR